MAGMQVEAGSALAQAIQSAVQPKLIENGWVTEDNDTTLSEYVTMMMVNGKDLQSVISELGGDLLGVGEDDPAVATFAEWLFDQVRAMTSPAQSAVDDGVGMQEQEQESQAIQSFQDSQMDDAAAAPADGVPSGPKAMRNGGAGAGRGRDKRMLGQINNHLNRQQDLPDPLRRIKGAASGQQGRINAHAGRDPPRGPRGNLANGVQRAMNGGGRGGRGGMGQMNPMMQQGNAMNQLDPQQQMAFMQMMEMQANMMTQMLQGGQVPNFGAQNGAGQGKSLFDRVDKKPNGHFKSRQQRNTDSQNGDGASSMDLDSEGNKKEPFDTPCRFNTNCTNPACPYAHQSPAAPPGQTMDFSDTCTFGAACENRKCVGRHVSPAQRAQHLKQEVDCKFFPNCNNPSCPFRHPEQPPCRNGADCAKPGCPYTHSKIHCRYNPCTKKFCPFKHMEGQKGVFKDKVWTARDGVPSIEGEGDNVVGGHGPDTSNRFAGFMANETQGEELILPGQRDQRGDVEGEQREMQAETQITT
ncbi:hypothetical protein LTR37_017658 [Vermiconidia calcicola]|uniref:Uncharacterized protein n=1 Tax=Vermiconidia calcicola TaxID=1690605 RepID=A0ACC3MJK1_9PEZI|nr:hypothetical protein LTR37_017658 [Vermiconidia calcicola]